MPDPSSETQCLLKDGSIKSKLSRKLAGGEVFRRRLMKEYNPRIWTCHKHIIGY
ncbi:hypothetical protein AKJ09_02435 [Labilithrix luteola]|uniref:Uncharacterized protein n=1 Tax=Labilithrix luteola TaxID=1391654 RepID=A0A0K1PQX3_9BACT|nr:hypothetical protein AKJ09_02435 [Labilithrix luteola]